MATLTVGKFNSAYGAEEALTKLTELQKEYLIELQDAAIVTWKEGKKKPKTKQAHNLVAESSIDAAFWGYLLGLIFFVPLLGMAVGAAAGALAGSLADYGIDDDFIKNVRDKVTEGTSALFLLTGQVTIEKLREHFSEDS